MKKTGSVVTVIFYVALLACVAVGGLFVYRFVNNGQKVFSVAYGAQSFTGRSEVTIYEGEYAFFKTSYLIGEHKGYTLSLERNPDAPGFDYVINGEAVGFKFTDLSAAFEVFRYDEYFCVYVPKNISMRKILNRANGQAVSDYTVNLDEMSLSETPYFALAIQSAGESETVLLNFKIAKRGEK